MTDPRIYLLRMLVFLGITFVIILLLFNELTIAFLGNPVFKFVFLFLIAYLASRNMSIAIITSVAFN